MASTPDGFLPNSITGVYAASRRSAFVVAAGTPARPIAVAVTPTTIVWAGGKQKLGDLSGCSIGDSVFAETVFTNLGSRVALWLETNLTVYWGTVTKVSDRALSVATAYGYDNSSGKTEEMQIVDMTQIVSAPAVGQSIYCVAGTARPDTANPGTIWARYVETWDSSDDWS
jgi:hypothetical protein